MTLRGRLITGFSAVLLLMLILSVLSFCLTERMSVHSKMAGHVDKGRVFLLSVQTGYLRFAAYREQQYAELSLKNLDSAIVEFEQAVPIAVTPQFRERLEHGIRELQRLKGVVVGVLAVLGEDNRAHDEAERGFENLLRSFDALSDGLRAAADVQGNEPHRQNLLLQLMALRNKANRARAAVNDLSTSSPQEEFDNALEDLKTMQAAAAELENRFQASAESARMEALASEMEGYYSHAHAYLSLVSGEAKELKATGAAFGEVEKLAAELSEFGVSQVQQDNRKANVIILLFSAMGLFLGVLIIFWLSRNTLRQLGKDPGELNALAGRVADGDYNVEDGSKKQGVYGAIVEMVHALKTHIENAQRESENAREQSAKAQQAMRKAEVAGQEAQAKTRALLSIANRLEEVGNVLSAASAELSARIEQSDRSAAESAQRLSEAAAAMNEMNATVQEVARNASSASSASGDTRKKAEAGARVVEKAVRSIEDVHHISLELKGDMSRLNEHARSIDRIMGVISDIADQTNLLALNAAIEAARAGEAGRGFAVVADEVRKLAEKTMASTHDVGNAIKAIQESTAKSTDSMDNAVAQIEEATHLANESGRALEEIVATADATADQVNAIAAASEEQSAASEEINRSILQCSDMSGQIAEAMAEAARAVSDLAVQAQGLTELIREMKNA